MDMQISKKMLCTMMSNRLNDFKSSYDADILVLVCVGEDIEKLLQKKATALDGKEELRLNNVKHHSYFVVKTSSYDAKQYEKDISTLAADLNDALSAAFNCKPTVKKSDVVGVAHGKMSYFIVDAGNISFE